MKTTIKYIIILVLLFTQTSCEKWLTVEPSSELIRDEYWESKEQVQAVLMAAYEAFSHMDGTLFLHGELRGGMITYGGSNREWNQRNVMEGNIYSDNGFCNWQDFYEVINYCNEVIENGPEVQQIDNTFEPYFLNSMMSEAYFLRSLAYFYLVRIYKDVPMPLEPSSTDEVDFFLPKTPENEVLNQLVSDLESWRQYAPSGTFATLAENKGRASKAAYDALLADIELWRYNYEAVITHVNKIQQSDDFKLVPTANWLEIFSEGNTLEGIFEFQFSQPLGQSNSVFGLTERSDNQYRPSTTAIEMFANEYKSGEIYRGEGASIILSGGYYIWKYIGNGTDISSTRSGINEKSANWIVYRYADVLLMKAEAQAWLGRFEEARQSLTLVRNRAGLAVSQLGNTTLAYDDAILNERALELAFEGKRWFDLVRMGRRNDFARKDKLIEIVVNNAPSTQKRILATKLTNPLGWFLPIFEGELERNLNLEQNPYYNF